MVELLLNATTMAVRIAILKRVYGYKTDRCRDIEALPSIKFEDLSPDALRKDAEEAQNMALLAAVPEIITVDIGRQSGSAYNSELVPVRTWPNEHYLGDAQHNLTMTSDLISKSMAENRTFVSEPWSFSRKGLTSLTSGSGWMTFPLAGKVLLTSTAAGR